VTHAEIAAKLQARWPEHRVAPSLARIRALCELLGGPQRSCPVIQVAGTNGKGSTAIMVESLLRALNLRVGRFSSPHLVDVTERIAIDGEPMSPGAFDELVADVLPLVELVDGRALELDAAGEPIPMTFFEVMTGLAYEAFAQAPVDVAVVEVGLGGAWDATSVADAQVAAICPIAFDHTHILGGTLEQIAAEKAGVIKPGAVAVLAAQEPAAAQVLLGRCAEVGAKALLDGPDFGLLDRAPAVGGQVIRLNTAEGPLGDIFLPLFGEHMAHNAALALAAAEAFLGGRALPAAAVAEGFEQVRAPARMEVVRRSPTIVLDTCHNPAGAQATMNAMREAFDFDPLIGVIAMMADKDVDGVLAQFAGQMSQVVCTAVPGTDRALEPAILAQRAASHFEPGMVATAADIVAALEMAVAKADEAGAGAGIIVCGSVYLAGQARSLGLSSDRRPG
jgi:dihydrofolate synthase/folylpolyglutamate synthase